jgi:NADPH:quinone reductase-like Zn-dependent oxidoreductase
MNLPNTAAATGADRYGANGRRNIINFAEEDIFERIKEISGGESADVVLDCVGMEASPVMGRGVSSAT